MLSGFGLKLRPCGCVQYEWHAGGGKETFTLTKKIGISFEGNKNEKVKQNSQASKAKIQVGWTIEKVNDEQVGNNSAAIREAIKEARDGAEEVTITFNE